MWTRVPLMDHRRTLLSRRPSIQPRHFSFLKFNPVFLLRHILLIRAQTTTVTHCENEPKELGKVGQKASKISCRKLFVAPNQSERGLMTAFVGSGGLSGGAVTNRQPCSRDDEQWRPDRAVKPLIEDTQEEKDSFHLYYRKPRSPQRLIIRKK